MIFKLFAAMLVACAVAYLLWLLRGLLLTPVRLGKNESLRLVLRVTGPAPALENSVRALLWLMDDGVLTGEVALDDDGMDDETRRVAALLARDDKRVTLWTKRGSSN